MAPTRNFGPIERHHALSRLPDGWRAVDTSGPPGFVTRAVLERPDGARFEWTSRRHRKNLGLRSLAGPGADPGAVATSQQGWRSPDAMSWTLAATFGVGSVLFALASWPGISEAMAPSTVAWVFFVGSLFFTGGGLTQYHEVLLAPEGVASASKAPGRLEALVGWRPRRLDWWAASIQLVGVVLFNISTFAGTRSALAMTGEQRLIWAPDVLGSVCFLVAGALSFSEVNRGLLPRPDGSLGWTIGAINLAGCLAFGFSAIGARFVTVGEVANVAVANGATFFGACCFLIGAGLLPVESSREASPVDQSA